MLRVVPLLLSEPVIGDIDGDGALEIVFGTRVPNASRTVIGMVPWDYELVKPMGLWCRVFPLPIPTPRREGSTHIG